MNATSSSAHNCSNHTAPVLRILPLVAAMAFGLNGAHAATIVVDDASASSVAGKCTLVDAIAAVNGAVAVQGCIAGNGDNDTIDLRAFSVPTSISLTQSTGGHALMVSSPLTIVGSLAADGTPLVTLERSSISGTPNFGLLMSSAALTIDGLILQNGVTESAYCGGALAVGDNLIVKNSIVRNNTSSGGGGGIFATGDTTLRNSVITGNSAANGGGGVVAVYALHAYYTTISNNRVTAADAIGGGGVYTSGTAIASHSTISGNTSSTHGGGVYSLAVLNLLHSTLDSNTAQNGPGGGAYARNGGISVQASTISNNSASTTGGGISTSDGDFTNSTISGNRSGADGAGIFANNATLMYSTLSANVSAGAGGGVNFRQSGVANGSIIYGNMPDDVNTDLHTGMTGAFDLIGKAPFGVPAGTLTCDPKLGTLADNGGDTQTMMLANGSCAVDAASASPSTNVDQRGLPRPGTDGNPADIGALESNSAQHASTDAIFLGGFQ